MNEVHRYKVVQMVTEGGGWIGYDPHGPEVVMASAYDELKAENEALRKDAERYRWLKVERRPAADLDAAFNTYGVPVDEAIDAAMAKEESQ